METKKRSIKPLLVSVAIAIPLTLAGVGAANAQTTGAVDQLNGDVAKITAMIDIATPVVVGVAGFSAAMMLFKRLVFS